LEAVGDEVVVEEMDMERVMTEAKEADVVGSLGGKSAGGKAGLGSKEAVRLKR